nr:MAG TPA: hypothetical protein [Caudoviricetes sp.]
MNGYERQKHKSLTFQLVTASLRRRFLYTLWKEVTACDLYL